jgi:hypothetical protein
MLRDETFSSNKKLDAHANLTFSRFLKKLKQ